MVSCPDCQGKGFTNKKVPKPISVGKVGWVLERVKCETCYGSGEVSASSAEAIRRYAKERAAADRAESKEAYDKAFKESLKL